MIHHNENPGLTGECEDQVDENCGIPMLHFRKPPWSIATSLCITRIKSMIQVDNIQLRESIFQPLHIHIYINHRQPYQAALQPSRLPNRSSGLRAFWAISSRSKGLASVRFTTSPSRGVSRGRVCGHVNIASETHHVSCLFVRKLTINANFQ